MAARFSPFDSPSATNDTANDYSDLSPSRPLSRTGASRQTRRLQLRNAGFRGGAVPTRKVTPKSTSTSTSGWGVLDGENVSPSGAGSRNLSVGTRQSSGVLQEIGNATLTRPKKSRPRLTSAKLFASMNNAGTAALDDEPQSPPPPKQGIRPRAVKTRAKMSQKRRSVSAEMSKYIDALEMELASTQSQLQAITSPTATREQSSKLRHMNAETKQLQQKLDEWETKYEERVQEAMDEHVETEYGLRNHIRALEEEAAEARFRLQELECQLEDATERMTATESANVGLEKRLEIMSELLAFSPTKIDLHAETPGRRRRGQRPQSMLPRFPTASSLVHSPERQSFTQPASPLLSFANHSPSVNFSPIPTHEPLRLDYSPNVSENEQTDAESVFSDAPGTPDSITSAETAEAQPHYNNPWSLPPVREGRPKPKTRMRKFNGSMGPKPLILPSTAGCEQYPPASAPPLDRSETTPAFFPDPRNDEVEELDLAIFGRRRASTTAGELRLSTLGSPPPFLEVPPQQEDDPELSMLTPHVDQFRETSGDYSTVGSKIGRNLMEELSAMSTNESGASVDGVGEEPLRLEEQLPCSPEYDISDGSIIATSSSATTQTPGHTRTRSRSSSSALHPTLSIFDRLRLLFSDLWRSPVALARHLVQTAQSRMHLPSPLLNAQWWLVGFLLGPMAKRRLLSRPRANCCSAEELLLEPESPSSEDLAYGSDHASPDISPLQRKGSLGGKGKKRAAGKTRLCTHQQQRRKHSPLLWLKFSLTLAFAVGAAFKDGPGSLLKGAGCACWVKAEERMRREGKLLGSPST